MPRSLVFTGWFFCITLFLASCSERAQEMEEKVTQLQRQLDQTQKQLQAANQALASRKPEEPAQTPSTTTESSAGLPSRDSLEQSYSARVSAFRKELDASLKDFRVESCTVHSVQMPPEFYPFTSQLSLAFVSTNGKNFTTDIPVKADATGKWVFPTVAEVTQRVEAAGRSANGATPSTAAAQRQTSATAEPAAPIMKVDGTFVIQWPNANAPGPSTRAPAPSHSAPAPVTSIPAAPATPPPVTAASPPPRAQPSATAAPVMPVDRDVQIQFPPP